MLSVFNAERIHLVSFVWIASKTAIIRDIGWFSRKELEVVVTAEILKLGNRKGFARSTQVKLRKSRLRPRKLSLCVRFYLSFFTSTPF